jgi:hypothetical protein
VTKPQPLAKQKAKKKLQRKKVAVVPAAPVETPAVPAVGATSGIPLQPQTAGKGLLFFIVVVALSCAIACLSAAVIPAKRVPWRPAAIFVWDRQFELALAGLALLAAVAMTLILSTGS